MQVVDTLKMFTMAVTDMPKAKEFYADKLGLMVVKDFKQDDANWYVTLAFPGGGATITLSTNHGQQTPGTMNMYFATSDIAGARNTLRSHGIEVSDVQDDLFGPGSGVKFCNLQDPDRNSILLVQQ